MGGGRTGGLVMEWLQDQLVTRDSPVRLGMWAVRMLMLVAGVWLAMRIEGRIRSRLGRGPTWREMLRDVPTKPQRLCVMTMAVGYVVMAAMPIVALCIPRGE